MESSSPRLELLIFKKKGGLDSNTFFLLDSKSIQALKGL